MESDDDEYEDGIVLNDDDFANVDMSEITAAERRVLRTLTQAKKATDNRRHVFRRSNEVLEFDAAQDDSALVLERLSNCTVRIYGRILHVTMLHNDDCVVEMSAPPLGGCDISRCRRLFFTMGSGDTSVHAREPRAVQCMYSTGLYLTMLAPSQLHVTTCLDVHYRLGTQWDYCSCPINPFSSAFQLCFPSECFS